MVFGVVFAANLMSTWISNAAKRSNSSIYAYLSKVEKNDYINQFKLVTLLEKMTDREIGYYCYDMFPMNNYEFYQYLSITGLNYFLIMDLVSKTNY